MASTQYHEPIELLSADTLDMHRALVSAIEELEAIDWYQQRADACRDDGLRKILLHNKNEEMEHFVMTLEWMRRRSDHLSLQLKKYLFSDGPIIDIEKRAKASTRSGDGSLGIRAVKDRDA